MNIDCKMSTVNQKTYEIHHYFCIAQVNSNNRLTGTPTFSVWSLTKSENQSNYSFHSFSGMYNRDRFQPKRKNVSSFLLPSIRGQIRFSNPGCLYCSEVLEDCISPAGFFLPIRLNLRGGHQTRFDIQVQREWGGGGGEG